MPILNVLARGMRLLPPLTVAAYLAFPNQIHAADLPVPAVEPEPPALPPSTDDLLQRIQDLENRIEQTRSLIENRRPVVTLGGYADFGFFAAQGDGSGVVRDNNNELFPAFAGRYGWVFLGDLLAPTVNSRGEAADLGDLPGARRFDGIHSGGAPGFLLNEMNLTLQTAVSPSIIGTASVNFVPRTGHDFALGDFIDVDLAQVEWLPTISKNTSIFVGKIDSVLGIEYRDRKAVNRFGISPSLLARYTTGTALGLKVRSKFGPDDLFVVAAAITNGSNSTEQFHFYDEVDRNAGKTGSARLSIKPPLPGNAEFELGVSGSYGAQDRARNSRDALWFWGVDLLGHVGRLDLKAQFLKGRAPGFAPESVYGLDLHKGFYLEGNYMLTPVIGLIGRGELRDALVWLGDANAPEGANRAYLTKSWRATGGLRFVLGERISVKLEYLRNGEYGGIPKVANDVFTSSLVFSN